MELLLRTTEALHITFYDNSSRSYMEVQLRTKHMDDIAEIGVANHLSYEKRQEGERARRDEIPVGECVYFDEAYERCRRLVTFKPCRPRRKHVLRHQ